MSEAFSSETAVQYLQQVAGRPASVDSLTLLAGNVGLAVREQLAGVSSSTLAFAYLQAAARHLPGTILPAAGIVAQDVEPANGGAASKVLEVLDVSMGMV